MLTTASFPFEDPVVVIKLKGQQLLEALQNGVSKHPALDGRFPQVSNITFTFDPSRNSRDRIVGVQAGGAPLDLKREYTLATPDFMVRGGGTWCRLQKILDMTLTQHRWLHMPSYTIKRRAYHPCD
jgi:2',3'-cyclic-nucleotide 2'-phosphodiesterase (5'-nucleotidase family)